jgi:hypothetical protein
MRTGSTTRSTATYVAPTSNTALPTIRLRSVGDADRYTRRSFYLSGRPSRLGPRLIKSTIRERRQGRLKPSSFALACRSGLRCA